MWSHRPIPVQLSLVWCSTVVLKEVVYKHLAERGFSEPFEGEYWPSQVWACLRKQFYDRLFPVNAGYDSARLTALGTVLHELIADLLKREESVRVSTEVPIRIPHPTNHEIVLSGGQTTLSWWSSPGRGT